MAAELPDLFKGVVYARHETVEGKQVHRYVIMGLLVTETPLEGFQSQQVVEGPVALLPMALQELSRREPKIRLGSADMVLTSLREI